MRLIGVDLELHAVEGGLDVWRKAAAERLVIKVGVEIGQDRAPRAQALDPGQRLVDGKMARMRTLAERIDDPYVQALQQRNARLRNGADVRGVGEAAEAQTQCHDASMLQLEGQHVDGAARARDRARLSGFD